MSNIFEHEAKKFVPIIIEARQKSKTWFAKCDESPDSFFEQFVGTMSEGIAPDVWRTAARWSGVPLGAKARKVLAENGLLNQVAMIKSWRDSEQETASLRIKSVVLWDLSQKHYVAWFKSRPLYHEEATARLTNIDIADMVEAALAFHLWTVSGFDELECMGNTEVFANWMTTQLANFRGF